MATSNNQFFIGIIEIQRFCYKTRKKMKINRNKMEKYQCFTNI